MIFGSLSERDVEGIIKILDSESIKYEVITDENVLSSNKDSLRNNLRYLHGPDLSNCFLAIKIESDLSDLSLESKNALLDFGITDEIPKEFKDMDFAESTPEPIDLVRGKRKIVGLTYGLGILLGLISLFLYYIYSSL